MLTSSPSSRAAASASPDTGTFELTVEQAAVLADVQSPTYLMGILEILAAMWASADRVPSTGSTSG